MIGCRQCLEPQEAEEDREDAFFRAFAVEAADREGFFEKLDESERAAIFYQKQQYQKKAKEMEEMFEDTMPQGEDPESEDDKPEDSETFGESLETICRRKKASLGRLIRRMGGLEEYERNLQEMFKNQEILDQMQGGMVYINDTENAVCGMADIFLAGRGRSCVGDSERFYKVYSRLTRALSMAGRAGEAE